MCLQSISTKIHLLRAVSETVQWCSKFFWHLGQVITMVSHNRNYEVQRELQLFINFFVILRNNLKIIEHRKSSVFHLIY